MFCGSVLVYGLSSSFVQSFSVLVVFVVALVVAVVAVVAAASHSRCFEGHSTKLLEAFGSTF